MKKNNDLTMEELEKKGGLLKNTKIACGLATILLLISIFIGTFFNVYQSTHGNAQKKQNLLENTNYSELATEDYNKKVSHLEEKIYKKEIAIKDYNTELAKIQKMTVEEFMEQYASAEEKAKYEQIVQEQKQAEKNVLSTIIAAGAVGIGGIAITSAFTSAQDSVEEEKKKRKPTIIDGFPAPEVEA